MDEYISREALLAEIAADYGNWIAYNDTDESYRQGVDDNYNDTIRLINDIPAADIQPVKHGRWIDNGSNMWLCSYCKENLIYSETESDREKKQRYCSRCGARMDGESE